MSIDKQSNTIETQIAEEEPSVHDDEESIKQYQMPKRTVVRLRKDKEVPKREGVKLKTISCPGQMREIKLKHMKKMYL